MLYLLRELRGIQMESRDFTLFAAVLFQYSWRVSNAMIHSVVKKSQTGIVNFVSCQISRMQIPF